MKDHEEKNSAPERKPSSLGERFRKDKLSWIGTIALGLVLVAVFTFTHQDLWREEVIPEEPLDIAYVPEPEQEQEQQTGQPDTAEQEGTEPAIEEPENEEGGDSQALEAAAAPEVWLPPALGEWERLYGFALDPTFEDYRLHAGMDMPLPVGELIFAAAGGEVVKSQGDELWGGRVEIAHGGGYTSVYLGITPSGIKEGQTVQGGDTIGTIAPSPPAEKAQASHLHFELWLEGQPIDPSHLLIQE